MTLLPPRSGSCTAAGLRLSYCEWGAPDAPVLLLQHGGLDHAHSWDWVAAEFAAEYRIIAPDLRGHGDSAWAPDGDYTMLAFVRDFARLVEELQLAPLRIIGHSLGGNIATRFAALYPAQVQKLVSIEGLGPSPKLRAEREAVPMLERMRKWLGEMRRLEARPPRRYPSVAAALERMRAAHPNLDAARAQHLTEHALRRNEDGSCSWKYDPRMRAHGPFDLRTTELEQLWAAVECPVLLCYGVNSWASNPAVDGRASHFRQARVSLYEAAGHWVHHDQFERFIAEARAFLR